MPERDHRAPDRREDADALRDAAASCWDAATRGYDLTDTDRAALVRRSLETIDRALALAPDRFRAVTIKTLLLRLQAIIESDPARRAALAAEAEALREKALELQKLAHLRAPPPSR